MPLRTRPTSRRAATVLLGALACTACYPRASTIRVDEPVPLAAGPAQTRCEQSGWYEVVPTRSFMSSSSLPDAGWVTTVSERVYGYSVYPFGGRSPEDLTVLLPKLSEPALAASHLGSVEPIIRRENRSRQIMNWSLGLAGVGVAFTLAGDPYTGIYPAVGGLVGALWSLFSTPSEDERTYAFVRQHAIPGNRQGQVDALKRGVSRMNEETRASCQMEGAAGPATDGTLGPRRSPAR